jgi:large subunit ribosomal protein L15
VNLSEVVAKVKKRPTRKRCGRGRGSGLGKTSGRGHKGAASRSGWKRRYGYDGGQTSLIRRLPKRGFSNHPFRFRFDVVNLGLLESSFNAGDTVRLETLVERGLVSPEHGRLKVLGTGDLKKKLTVVAYTFSEPALKKIEAAGGKVERIGPPKKIRKPVPVAVKKPKAAEKEPAAEAKAQPEAGEKKKEKKEQKKKGASPEGSVE